MSDQLTAGVLLQDGPTEEQPEVTAEESVPAEPTEAGGETEPQADAKEGETAEHKKRLGGWQRKIQKLEQEVEVWRDQALRTRSDKADDTKAEPDPEKPIRPKLSTFAGTVEEFEKAQEEYEAKMEKWTETTAQRKAIEREVESSVASLGQQLAELPELEDMKASVRTYKMPDRLTNLLVAEAAKLKNGAEVLKALLLDPDEAAQLAAYDKFEDANGIKAQIVSMSRALRIAGKKSEQAEGETDDKPAPKKPAPITPVKKVASTAKDWLNDTNISPEEWARRRNAEEAQKR